MPHALLYSMTYRLHQIGADLSEDLRRSVLERSEPIDVDASSGRLSFIEVEGELLLAYRMTFSGEQALASLFDDSWLVVLCPTEKSAALVLAHSLGIAAD
jgi:hypothetical protein